MYNSSNNVLHCFLSSDVHGIGQFPTRPTSNVNHVTKPHGTASIYVLFHSRAWMMKMAATQISHGRP